MTKYISILIMSFFVFASGYSQVIRIDSKFEDWDGIDPIFVDQLGDGQNNGFDFENVWVYNDEAFIYFRFELNKEVNLQDNNEVAIYVDYDNDINTGFKINGIGAELRYFFGERFGVISDNGDNEFVNFDPVQMTVAPTVSGDVFELAFARNVNDSGVSFSAGDIIQFRIEDNSFSGDEVPEGLQGIKYEIDNSIVSTYPDLDLSRGANTSFRFMTYNIEVDQLFDVSRKANFRRIFQSTNPDIIAFQEIRDFDSQETKDLIEEFLPGTWYHKKHGFDIVTLSRYPILFSESVDGNAAFYMDVDGQEVLLINCHLPCCDNNDGRQDEVDIIMEYIREFKAGNGNFQTQEAIPIIIAGDMNFVGDNSQPNTFINGDIFNNGSYGPDFMPDWDGSPYEDVDATATNTTGNYTWVNPNGSFYPGKLDWIVYSDSRMDIQNTFALWTSAMTNAQLSENGLQSNDVVRAADHLPVVADFSFETVRTNDFLELDVDVYPNPTTDRLIIDSKDETLIKIRIINQLGAVVKSINDIDRKKLFIDIETLQSGVYFLLLETKEGRSVRNVIKE